MFEKFNKYSKNLDTKILFVIAKINLGMITVTKDGKNSLIKLLEKIMKNI